MIPSCNFFANILNTFLTLLNIFALAVLGVVMFSSVDFFNGHHTALVAVTVGPLAIALTVLVAPALVPRQTLSRHARMHALTARKIVIVMAASLPGWRRIATGRFAPPKCR